MKLLALIALVVGPSLALCTERENVVAAVRAADDARIAAMIAADSKALDALLSDRLHYAHSAEGYVENKATHIGHLARRIGVYRKFDFKTRDFEVLAPGIVLSKGRALVEVGSTQVMFLVDINFLAVWQLESERWRLVAWQSSRNREAEPLGPSSPPPDRN